MDALFGFDQLFPELILGLGLALILGNGFAMIKERRGERPADAEGEFRVGRAVFLSAVGTVMALWGALSVFG